MNLYKRLQYSNHPVQNRKLSMKLLNPFSSKKNITKNFEEIWKQLEGVVTNVLSRKVYWRVQT